MAECIALSRSSSGGYSVYRFDETRQDFIFDTNKSTGNPEIWFPDGHTLKDLEMLSVMASDPYGNYCCYYGAEGYVFMTDKNIPMWNTYLAPDQQNELQPFISLLPNVTPNVLYTRIILVMKE